MNVQKIVNDANILIAAMPFSFLLRWDEKVCDGTFLGTGQGSDGKRLGLGEKFRRLQEAEFFFLCYLIECMNPLCLWPSLPNNATFNHLQPIWTLPFCSKSKLHLQFDRTLDLLEHFWGQKGLCCLQITSYCFQLPRWGKVKQCLITLKDNERLSLHIQPLLWATLSHFEGFENDYKKKNKQNSNLSSLAYNRCSRIYARSATNH